MLSETTILPSVNPRGSKSKRRRSRNKKKDKPIDTLLDRRASGKAPTLSLSEHNAKFYAQVGASGPEAQLAFADKVSLAPGFAASIVKTPANCMAFKDREIVDYDESLNALPGLQHRDAEEEEGYSGYTLELYNPPILVGKRTNLFFDSTTWAKSLNERLDKMAPQFPRIPFVTVELGAIGAGKTTCLIEMLQVYQHLFKRIVICSSTMGMDSLMLDFIYKRDPECDIQILPVSDFNREFINRQQQEVLMDQVPYQTLAKEGMYTKPVEDKPEETPQMTAFKRTLIDDHSLVHPYLNKDGTRHGKKLQLPAVRDETIGEHIPSLNPTTVTGFSGSRYRFKYHPISETKTNKRKREAEDADDYDFEAPKPNMPNPVITNKHSTNYHLLQHRITDPEHNAGQARLQKVEKAIATNTLDNVQPKSDERAGTLYVLEDMAYMRGTYADDMKHFVTVIRHFKGSMIWLTQSTTGIPTAVRNNCTDFIAWRLNNKKELQRMLDDFGGVVPDFEGRYIAATTPIGEHDRDFLYVNIRNKEASRSFLGKLIPSKKVVKEPGDKAQEKPPPDLTTNQPK